MDLLRDAARRHPHAPALSAEGERWTWGSLDAAGDEGAAWLRGRGARPGVTVATLLPTSPEGILTAFAVPRTGATLAPLNPRLTAPEIRAALASLDPAVLVCDAGTEARAREAAGPEGSVRVARIHPLGAHPFGVGASAAPSTEEAAAARPYAVLWTSGTTGHPRGVALAAEAFVASGLASRDRLGLVPSDRWYAALALAHVGGLALVTRAAVVGCSLVSTLRFDAEALSGLVDAGAVTHASLVPTMLRRLLDVRGDRPFPSGFRALLLGGAHTPRPLLDRALAAGVPVALTYGMTEATSQAATAPPELVRRKPGTVGPPLDGVRIAVAEDGEILLAGATLALGHVPPAAPLVDPEGWLHTGDLGEVDGEGHLWVSGRRSDRVISGGVNVDPAEVEEVLRLHEGVEDAAVAGLPDDEWGEIVGALVVRRPGFYPDPGELETLARERLTSAKIPRRWGFAPEIPRNANGKVDRGAVRAMLLEEPPGPG